jgi:hypothetical protein
VAKSKFMLAVIFARSLNKAQQIYYSSHGKYASAFSELDLDLPAGGTLNQNGNIIDYPDKFWCTIDNITYYELYCSIPRLDMAYIMYFRSNTGRCRIENQQNNPLGHKICVSLGHQAPINMSGSYVEYLY